MPLFGGKGRVESFVNLQSIRGDKVLVERDPSVHVFESKRRREKEMCPSSVKSNVIHCLYVDEYHRVFYL